MRIINNILSILFNILNAINKNKIIIYPIFFTIYFFMYYSIVIPQILFSLDEKMLNKINEKINNMTVKISIIILMALTFIIFMGLIFRLKFYFKDKYEKYYLWILVSFVIIFNILIPLNIISYEKEFGSIANNSIMNTIFYVFSIIFYIIFFGLFLFNTYIGNSNFDKLYPFDINTQLNYTDFFNTEFILSLVIIFIFFIGYIIITKAVLNSIYYKLENYDSVYLTLTTRCPLNSNKEAFDNENNDSINSSCKGQINKILEKHGNNYLKLLDNIPIAFLNTKINDYQDLTVADFYYPGSYYTYTAATPLNSIPSLIAIRTAMTEYKVRIVHLDIFIEKDTNEPIVRSEKMKEGAESLKFIDCLNEINNNAWTGNTCSKNNYPMFLYLKFNFDESKDITINYEMLYIKIFEYLMRVFSMRLMDKKYSFSGRNGLYNIASASIKEALNKLIIITNKYPSHSILDEIINGCSNNLNIDLNIQEYKKSYVDYPYPEGPGLAVDHNREELLNNCKKNLHFFYSEPNPLYTNPQQAKAGLYNPHFQDCAQYGVQSTLMYLFTPDNNFRLWKDYFEKINNFHPVLKDEILRNINEPIPVIHKQQKELTLGPPEKECVVRDQAGNCISDSNK